MSFAFGFNDDDISDDEIQGTNLHTSEIVVNPLSELSSNLDPQFVPQLHSLDSILSKLINVRITFDNHTTAGGNVTYRRELYDIKHQVMCEDNHSALVNDILMGDESAVDLKKNVYEGGFKSWECSYDLVDNLVTHNNLILQKKVVLELGCGTSLPSCQLLLNKLSATPTTNALTLILSDFNYEVLRLVSLPNLIIYWASTLDPNLLQELCQREVEGSSDTNQEASAPLPNDEILLTPKLLRQFQNDLTSKNITIEFISGSWGNEFLSLVQPKGIDFLISSETIYSLETLPIVAETILSLKQTSSDLSILVAAKNFYFGVGGSVIEFVNYLEKQISIRNLNLSIEVDEMNSQLKRSIIKIDNK